MSSNAEPQKKRGMGVLDLTLFSVCAVLVIDTLTASALIGPSSISWWLITLVLFVVPYGMIASELGTTWPGEGGIYDWVKRAYGPRWGVRTTWFYWVNVALWMPSVYILFAGMFAELFYPEMTLWTKIGIGIGLTWLTVWICNISVEEGKLVPNLGAIAKVVIILALGGGGFYLAMTKGVANEITLSSMVPSLDSGLSFLPAIVFNLLGFELVSSMGDEIRNPREDVPKSIFASAASVTVLYVLGTIGILLALPVEEIGLVDGIVASFRIVFAGSPSLVILFGIIALFTFISNMVTWCMGANRAAQEAAEDGELPAIFAVTNSKNAPSGVNLITGIVSTVVMVAYGFMATNHDELFWTLFAFSSCVFLLPYLFMFPSFLKLRSIDADEPRPYKVPGGAGFAFVAALVPTIFVIQAIALFIFPDLPTFSIDWGYSFPVLLGVIGTIIIGELIVRNADKKRMLATSKR